jgi:hypothetical protein
MSHHHDHDHGHGHDHDHSHGGAHDHSDDITPVLQRHIYDPIEFDKITTLNESESKAGTAVVKKTWAQRLDTAPMLASDADEQVLMTVPFAGTVKLHSILIRTSEADSAPKTVKLFINKDGLDFSTAADLDPVQTLTLSQTGEVQDVPVKRALFNNTYSITLFVEDNFGEDVTEIFYLGFKGDFTRLNREPVEVLYEKAANPKDHAPIVGTETGLAGAGGSRRGM